MQDFSFRQVAFFYGPLMPLMPLRLINLARYGVPNFFLTAAGPRSPAESKVSVSTPKPCCPEFRFREKISISTGPLDIYSDIQFLDCIRVIRLKPALQLGPVVPVGRKCFLPNCRTTTDFVLPHQTRFR